MCADVEDAVDNSRWIALTLSSRSRHLRRLVNEPELLSDCIADDFGCLPVREGLAAGDHISLATMSGLCKSHSSDRGNVSGINIRNLTVAGRRIHDTIVDDVFKLRKEVLHEVVRPKYGPIDSRLFHLLLDLIMPN